MMAAQGDGGVGRARRSSGGSRRVAARGANSRGRRLARTTQWKKRYGGERKERRKITKRKEKNIL